MESEMNSYPLSSSGISHGAVACPLADSSPKPDSPSIEFRRAHRKAAVCVTLCMGLLSRVVPAAPASDGSEFINLQRLSDRVMLATWVGLDRRCNLTAIRTEKGMVIIDTEMSPRVMAPIKEQFERVFKRKDWVYVINTHAHDNHAGGNSLFTGATIVGHENLAEDMQWIVRRQTDPTWKNRELDRVDQYVQKLRAGLPEVAARSAADARLVRGEMKFWELHTQDLREGYEVVKPSVTFTDRHRLNLGDLQLELVFFGKGHSRSDTVVYVPQEKLLVTGGVAYPRPSVPEINDYTTLDDVRRFLAVLNGFLANNVNIDHVVPGHSAPMFKRDLVPVRDYYLRMLTDLSKAQREGLTLDQAKARLTANTFAFLRGEPIDSGPRNLHEHNLTNLWRILQEKK
jgi:cyclase